jgi:hypothetical protein
MLTTTLELLHTAGACTARYRHLCEALGGATAYGKDTPIPLSRILDTNGLDDALWALVAVPDHEVAARDWLARIFACDCAERALPIFERERPDDKRPREAIATARRFATGQPGPQSGTQPGPQPGTQPGPQNGHGRRSASGLC